MPRKRTCGLTETFRMMITTHDFLKLGLLFLTFFKWMPCTGTIYLCRDDIDLNFYLPETGSTKNISICVVNRQLAWNLSEITVQLSHNSVVYKSEEHVNFFLDRLDNHSFNFNFNLKINSTNDYGAWNVNISASTVSFLELQIMILQQVDSELNFTLKKYKENNYVELKLICEGTNYPKYLEISQKNGTIISKLVNNLQNYKKKLKIKADFQVNYCSSFGLYVCSMTDYKNKTLKKTLDDFDKNCPPKLCSANSTEITTNEKSTIILKVCVVHRYSLDNVTIYDTSGTMINDTRWSYVCKPRNKYVEDVEITFRNVQEKDFKMYRIMLIFSPNYNLIQYLKISLKDHPKLLKQEKWMPKDVCNGLSTGTYFRTIKSGLQLRPDDLANNITQSYYIIQTFCCVDYYIKIVLTNCTHYINKNVTVNITAGSSTVVPITLEIKEQSVIRLSLCNSSTDGSVFSVQFGQTFKTEICVNSSHVISRDDLGINGIPMANLTSDKKYVLPINKTFNQYIAVHINNITIDDVTMHTVKIQLKMHEGINFTFFLRLTEGPPVLCYGTSPQTMYNVTSREIIAINICLQSYPELSPDVLINGIIHNTSSKNNQIIVESNFNETALTYKMKITFENMSYENAGLYNISFITIQHQAIQIPFFLNVTRDWFRIRSFTINGFPNMSSANLMSKVILNCTVTSQYNAFISIWKDGKQSLRESNDSYILYHIHNVTCNDTGMYYCTAQHSMSSEVSSSKAFLEIKSCNETHSANNSKQHHYVSWSVTFTSYTSCRIVFLTFSRIICFQRNY